MAQRGTIHSFVSFVTTLLFPLSRDASLVAGALSLSSARARNLHVDDVRALMPYADPLVRACIAQAKFHHNKKAIELLGEVLASYCTTLPQQSYLLIPVPLSRERYRARGYNQVAEVARAACSACNTFSINENVLVRARSTKPQAQLKRAERLKNVADAFGIRDVVAQKALTGAHIVLLDDVVTTGATMRAARAALAPPRPCLDHLHRARPLNSDFNL